MSKDTSLYLQGEKILNNLGQLVSSNLFILHVDGSDSGRDTGGNTGEVH